MIFLNWPSAFMCTRALDEVHYEIKWCNRFEFNAPGADRARPRWSAVMRSLPGGNGPAYTVTDGWTRELSWWVDRSVALPFEKQKVKQVFYGL